MLRIFVQNLRSTVHQMRVSKRGELSGTMLRLVSI